MLRTLTNRGISYTSLLISRRVNLYKIRACETSASSTFGIQISAVRKRSFYGANRRNFRRKNKFSIADDDESIASNWDDVVLKPFKKDFYVPHEKIISRSEKEVQDYRKQQKVSVYCPAGFQIPRPIQHISEANFPDYVNDKLKSMNTYGAFKTPNIIQGQGWPIAMSGHNMVGVVAQSESEKIMAYILPAIVHINNQPQLERGDGPIVLVLVPTRKLAQKIKVAVFTYGTSTHVRSTCLFGGAAKGPQERRLMMGNEIVIATPDRLLDFLKMGSTNLKRTTYVVVDGADRMLDMGFEPQIRKILEQIRPDRQVLMWSETWSEEIRSLAEDFLHKDYIHLQVDSLKLDHIEQHIDICEEEEKEPKLIKLLDEVGNDEECKTIIFAETKRTVDLLTRRIRSTGVRVVEIHDDESSALHWKKIDAFRDGPVNVLIAPEATRLFDAHDVQFVINYDFPKTTADYIHRMEWAIQSSYIVTSYSFFTEESSRLAKGIIKVLEEADQTVNPELEEMASRTNHKSSKNNSFRPYGYEKYGNRQNQSYGDTRCSRKQRRIFFE